MNYIVYKTINLLSGRFYVGVHGTENPDIFDGYFGSNKLLHAAIKKYGKENFIRETLIDCLSDIDEAYSIESILVKTNKEDPRSYNLEPGGHGNCNFGKIVVERQIGIHAATFKERSEWSKANQANLDPSERKKMCSRGGIKTAELGKAGFQTCSTEQRKIFSQTAIETKKELGIESIFKNKEFQRLQGIKGGKATKGFRTYNDGLKEMKFKSSNPLDKELTEIEFINFLADNPTLIKGRLFYKRNL